MGPMPRLLCLMGCLALAACSGGVDDASPGGSVRVGGQVAGLGSGKQVVIGEDAGSRLAVSANGPYSLSLPAGAAYSLHIQSQPLGQTCTVANGSGLAQRDVDDIAVTCADDVPAASTPALGGTVQGLALGGSLTLQALAAGTVQDVTVVANGAFQFAHGVLGSYAILVKQPPAGQACTVLHAQGTAGQTPPAQVICSPSGAGNGAGTGAGATGWRIGGTVQGNAGVVALRNLVNGDTVALTADGAFSFPQPVPDGARFQVVVLDQSANQACGVSQGVGVAAADVAGVRVQCAAVAPAGALPPPVAVPATPAGLTLGYSIKAFNLAWAPVAAPAGGGTVSYRVYEDPDGAGPLTGTPVGGTLTVPSFTRAVTSLLHTRLNAAYSVQACNLAGCGTPSAAVTADAAQAIGYLKASNTGAGDLFGISVAISGDGQTLAVGAPGEDSAATGIGGNPADNGASNAGAVYVFVRGAGGWSQQAYVKASNAGTDDSFGTSVALSFDGSTLAVGAHLEKGGAAGVGANQADDSRSFAGAAYVFTRSGGSWSQQAYIKASNPDISDEFGGAVALSADGNTLAVGAVGEDSGATGVGGAQGGGAATSGAVYVFVRDAAAAWSQQAYVKASNTGANDRFGHSVALSADGATLAVGAVGEASNATGVNGNQADNSLANAGAAYVFVRSGAAWSQQAYLKSSNPGPAHVFGTSVALSADGAALAVGATGEGGAGGAAYVFARGGGGVWAPEAYVKPAYAAANQWFGRVVALSGDGQVLAVGARNESSNARGIGGNPADSSAAEAGAAYVFTRAGGAWTQQAYIKASNTRAGDRFSSVALSADGQTLAVGARNEDSAATGIGGNQADGSAPDSGAVYLY